MSRDDVKGTEHLAARRAVLLRVFRALAARWPKAFAAGRADELMPIWLQGVGGIDADLLETAAVRFAAEHEGRYPPDPPEFARFARGLQARHLHAVGGGPATEIPAPDTTKQLERTEQLSRWAYERVGSWALVSEVWALLMETAPDADHRQQVRDGSLNREIFREAVIAVKNGKRVTRRGPLADVAGAA